MLVKPTDIYETAKDITAFIEREDVSPKDKKVILEMCRDFYSDRNEHTIDQWLAQFLQRTIDRHFPPTSME